MVFWYCCCKSFWYCCWCCYCWCLSATESADWLAAIGHCIGGGYCCMFPWCSCLNCYYCYRWTSWGTSLPQGLEACLCSRLSLKGDSTVVVTTIVVQDPPSPHTSMWDPSVRLRKQAMLHWVVGVRMSPIYTLPQIHIWHEFDCITQRRNRATAEHSMMV